MSPENMTSNSTKFALVLFETDILDLHIWINVVLKYKGKRGSKEKGKSPNPPSPDITSHHGNTQQKDVCIFHTLFGLVWTTRKNSI